MDQMCAENCRRLNELEKSVAEETARNQAEHSSFKRRIGDLEDGFKQQNGILVTLQKQADAIESIDKKIDVTTGAIEGVSARLDKIEQEPADKWKKISFEIVKYIVIAALGVVVGVIFKI